MKRRRIVMVLVSVALVSALSLTALAEPAREAARRGPAEAEKVARQAREINRWLNEHPKLAERIIRNFRQHRGKDAAAPAPRRPGKAGMADRPGRGQDRPMARRRTMMRRHQPGMADRSRQHRGRWTTRRQRGMMPQHRAMMRRPGPRPESRRPGARRWGGRQRWQRGLEKKPRGLMGRWGREGMERLPLPRREWIRRAPERGPAAGRPVRRGREGMARAGMPQRRILPQTRRQVREGLQQRRHERQRLDAAPMRRRQPTRQSPEINKRLERLEAMVKRLAERIERPRERSRPGRREGEARRREGEPRRRPVQQKPAERLERRAKELEQRAKRLERREAELKRRAERLEKIERKLKSLRRGERDED